MIMNPRIGKYPVNLIRFLRELDPKAKIVDCYEKDHGLLDDVIEEVTDDIDNAEEMLYDFWAREYTLKRLSWLYNIDYPKVKPFLIDVAKKLLAAEPPPKGKE